MIAACRGEVVGHALLPSLDIFDDIIGIDDGLLGFECGGDALFSIKHNGGVRLRDV